MTMDPSKLDALRARISGIKVMGGGSFWKPSDGKNVIRIMPPANEDGLFFAELGRHRSPDGKSTWNCPSFTLSAGKPCPICELIDRLGSSASKADKQLADDLGLEKRFLMWIIDREDEGRGPQIFEAKPTIFSRIAAYVQDVDYGDLSDPNAGFDLKITKSGKGMDTTYETMPMRNPSPLTKDQDTYDEWMGKIVDLATSKYVACDTPDEIMDSFSKIMEEGGGNRRDEEEEEKPNPAASARSALQQKAATPPAGNSGQQSSGGLKRTVLRR